MRVLAMAVAVGMAAGGAAAEDGVPDLVGTWTGTYTGGVRLGGDLGTPSPTPTTVKPGDREIRLTIATQDGRGLIGTVGTGDRHQPIHGVIRMDNRTVLLTDRDSVNQAVLLSGDEMELCHQTTEADEMSAFCFVLRRE